MSGQNFKLSQKRHHKKTIIVIAIIVILLAGAAVAYFLLTTHNDNKQNTTKPRGTTSNTTEQQAKVDSVRQEASQAANGQGGSVDKAVSIYDDAIKNTPSSDKATTGALYYNKSTTLYNAGKDNDALAAALKAVELQPDASSYGLLGDIYDRLGDKANAIAAYKKALTYLDSMQADGAGKAAMTSYYQKQINNLGGS